MRVANATGGASFLLESLSDSGVGSKLGLQDFDRDLFIHRDVACAIDFAHTARAQWFFDQVFVYEGSACEPAGKTV
jgi:hypothetical protein